MRNRILVAGKLAIITFIDSGRLASNTAGVFSDLKQGSTMTYFKHASQIVKKKKGYEVGLQFLFCICPYLYVHMSSSSTAFLCAYLLDCV